MVVAGTDRTALLLSLATNCSLTLNFSPWSANNGGSWNSGPFDAGSSRERHSVTYFTDRVSDVIRWVAQANSKLGANISIAAMLLDQEPGWAVTPSTNATYLAAMKRKSDLIFNATVELLGSDVKIDMFGWGCIEKAMGLSKVPVGDPINGYANGGSVNGLWCGFGKGWGNADVQRCGCNGYALSELVQSSGPDLYMVGNMDVTQQSFNRTANNGLARGARTSTPWIWLGGGYRQVRREHSKRFNIKSARTNAKAGQDIAEDGGFLMDFTWDYQLYNSWSLGKQINDGYYGAHPTRFARWDLVEYDTIIPSSAALD